MGTSGGVPRGPGQFLDGIPPEIHVEILKHLPPLQILDVIQLVRGVRNGIAGWNLAYFTAEQLVYLHQFIQNALKIEAEGREQNKFKTFDIRSKIIKTLPKAFQKYHKVNKPPFTTADYFNCHYHKLVTLASSESDGEISNFLKDFHYKNRIVRRFCKTLTELDPHGKVTRWGRPMPNKLNEARISHLLFWLATEYTVEQSEQKNRGTVEEHWQIYLLRVGEIFGEESDTSKEFRECITQGPLLLKYRDFVGSCDSVRLTEIHNALLLRGSDDINIGNEDYSTYMLVLGLDRALDFLNECPEMIASMKEWKKKKILSWGGLWTHFKEDYSVGYAYGS